jgi:hypothetical protein
VNSLNKLEAPGEESQAVLDEVALGGSDTPFNVKTGSVALEGIIGIDGKKRDIKVISSTYPEFEQLAVWACESLAGVEFLMWIRRMKGLFKLGAWRVS